jgi:thiamine-phosphate pyrophosphorylase
VFGRNKSPASPPESSLRKLFPRPIFCYVSDRRSLLDLKTGNPVPTADAISVLAQKIEAFAALGIDWIQIREKDLSVPDLISLTQNAQRSTFIGAEKTRRHTRIFVNDSLDTVLATKPFGAHLGEKASLSESLERLEAYKVRRVLFVGKSCHSLESAIAAERDGADYVFFGPVFATPAKAAFGAPQGLDRLAEVCRSVQIPVLAIGGITDTNFAPCLESGAAGIAAIRLFQDALDPAGMLKALRQTK